MLQQSVNNDQELFRGLKYISDELTSQFKFSFYRNVRGYGSSDEGNWSKMISDSKITDKSYLKDERKERLLSYAGRNAYRSKHFGRFADAAREEKMSVRTILSTNQFQMPTELTQRLIERSASARDISSATLQKGVRTAVPQLGLFRSAIFELEKVHCTKVIDYLGDTLNLSVGWLDAEGHLEIESPVELQYEFHKGQSYEERIPLKSFPLTDNGGRWPKDYFVTLTIFEKGFEALADLITKIRNYLFPKYPEFFSFENTGSASSSRETLQAAWSPIIFDVIKRSLDWLIDIFQTDVIGSKTYQLRMHNFNLNFSGNDSITTLMDYNESGARYQLTTKWGLM